MKKAAVFLMLLVFCFSCLSVSFATSLTKEERYSTALEELVKYLNDESSMQPETLQGVFADLGSYEYSAALNVYTNILVDIENGSFANTTLRIKQLQRNGVFESFLSENGLGTLTDLENYAYGREAELNGDINSAVAYYGLSIAFMDSMERIFALEEIALERDYDAAIAYYRTGTLESYQQAYELLAELAQLNYRDCRQLLEMVTTLIDDMRTASAVGEAKQATAKGYQSDVTVTVYFDAQNRIVSISVDASGETSGFGARCGEDLNYLNQFIGKTLPVSGVDVLSGATATSNAVLEAVNMIASAQIEIAPWPVMEFQLETVTLTGNQERAWGRIAPDAESVTVGGYKVNKHATYTALFREGNFIYCDAVYSGVERRCVYFNAGNVSGKQNVQTIEFDMIDATLNQTVSPRLGPDASYELYDAVILHTGATVRVCCQYGNWLFIEYEYAIRVDGQTEEGLGRGWVDCSAVTPAN